MALRFVSGWPSLYCSELICCWFAEEMNTEMLKLKRTLAALETENQEIRQKVVESKRRCVD